MKQCNITVSGKVQGVWFRKFTQQKALELGVNGFVRNLPDGNVYAQAQGTESALQQFVSHCHKGPEHASVEHVDVQFEPIQNLFTGFAIRH